MVKSPLDARQSGDARSPSPLDRHIGARVRLARQLKNMSQERLGEHLGVTFQQVQKYERGANRLAASRLLRVAQVTGQPLTFFYVNYDDAPEPGEGLSDVIELDSFPGLDAQSVRRTLIGLGNLKPAVRSRIVDLIEAVGLEADSAKAP